MLKLQHKDNDKSVWLVGPKMRVGASRDNDVVLAGEGVADVHAELFVEGENVAIAPVGANPLLVNGKAVSGRVPLKIGDEVTLGSREFTIVPPKQGAAKPATQKAVPDDANATVMRKVAKIEPVGKGTGWMLQATHQSLGNKRYPINGKVVIGRAQECELSFSYDRLSRRHAELKLVNGALHVKDLDSSNGTFVNGKRVDSVRLQPGDTLSFDKLSFTVVGPSDAALGGATDELNKTVIRPAIDPDAVNRALKQSQSVKAEHTFSKTKSAGSNLMIVGVVAVIVIGAAAYFLL